MTRREDTTDSTRGRRAAWIITAAVFVLLAGVVVAVVLYARGGGPLPEWAAPLRPGTDAVFGPSSPAESVLRTLRLAGYQRAAVGDEKGTVVVRVEAPAVSTSADVQLTWQTAMAAVSSAYPSADTLVVQVFVPAQPLLQVSAPAEAVRAAVSTDDAARLRAACSMRYLSELTGG